MTNQIDDPIRKARLDYREACMRYRAARQEVHLLEQNLTDMDFSYGLMLSEAAMEAALGDTSRQETILEGAQGTRPRYEEVYNLRAEAQVQLERRSLEMDQARDAWRAVQPAPVSEAA